MPEYPHHLRAFDYRGLHRYFLTFCTFERRRCFTSEPHVNCVRTQMLRAGVAASFAIPAYCFMPDHVHLLAAGEVDSSDLTVFVKRFKQCSGYHFNREFGLRLWQRYGYERVLRDTEDSVSVIRYIINNPIRSRLVTSVAEYPFWGSLTSTRGALLELIQSL